MQEDSFNIPGLFRHCYEAAKEERKTHVSILIPESQKDELIDVLTHTQFVQTYSPIKRATIPGSLTIEDIHFSIEATELENNTMVINIA
jgi:hypothetical protein